jgi:hypothetical protein
MWHIPCQTVINICDTSHAKRLSTYVTHPMPNGYQHMWYIPCQTAINIYDTSHDKRLSTYVTHPMPNGYQPIWHIPWQISNRPKVGRVLSEKYSPFLHNTNENQRRDRGMVVQTSMYFTCMCSRKRNKLHKINPGGSDIFRSVQTGPEAQPASCTVGNNVFPGDKAAGAWRWPPIPI